MFGALASAISTLPGPVQATQSYCYHGTPPKGVVHSEIVPGPFFGFDYVMIPHAIKLLCGLPADAEAANLREMYQGKGCSPESDVGAMVEEQINVVDRTEILAGFGLRGEPDAQSPYYQALCIAAEKAAMPSFVFLKTEDEYTDDERRMVTEKLEPNIRALFEAMDAFAINASE